MPAAGKILVVDDEPSMRELLRLHLANQPHEVREQYDDLARDLEMVALNLKNLK